MKKHKMKKSRKLLIAGLTITSIVVIPISVVACGGTVTLPEASQKEVDAAQTVLTSAITKNEVYLNSQASDLYVNLVQNYNVQNYLKGLPVLDNDMQYVYTINSSDNVSGSITVSILVYGGINSNSFSKTPSILTLSGFKKGTSPKDATQAQVNLAQENLNSAFNSGQVLLNAAGFFVFANTINNSNVSNYITGLPTLSDNMQYNYQLNSTNQSKGAISVTISVSAGSITNNTLAPTSAQTILGFMLPLPVADLNQIMITIDGLLSSKPMTVKVNKTGASVEAQNITDANVYSYLDGLGILNKNASYNFSVKNNNIAGSDSINLQISLSSGSTITSKSSNVVTISGFAKNPLTTQNEVDAAQTALTTAITKNEVVANTSASKIYVNLVQNYNIQTYVKGLPPLTGGMQYIFTNISSSTNTVTATITVYANPASGVSATTSSSITLTGFQINPPNATQAEVNAAQTALNSAITAKDIVLNNAGSYFESNNITSSNIQQYLSGLPTLSNNMIYGYKVVSVTSTSVTVTISISAGAIKNTVTAINYVISGFLIPKNK